MSVGLITLVVGLAIVGWLAADHGWHHFIDYDARFYRAVSVDLDASKATAGDSAYRYGRIGLPVLARALALGGAGRLLDATQMLVTPLAAALLVAAAVAIAERCGRRWTDGLVVLLVPGLWVGFGYAWADTLLAACVLGSVWATVAGRNHLCVGAIALAALTKEVGALAALPAACSAWREGERRQALARLCGLLPAAAWWTWVRLQSGEWPFLADEPARARAISPPFLDLVDALTGGRGDASAALLAMLIALAGLYLLVARVSDVLAWSAGIWGALTACLGDNVLLYPGDTLRVMTPAMAVVLLAVRLRTAPVPAAEPLDLRLTYEPGA